MDAVVGLLDGVRARGAFVLRLMLDPPWSMSIRDEAPLTVICQTHGRAVIVGDSSGTIWLDAGDVALMRGTEHYIFAHDPATKPTVVIHPGQRCTTLSGDDLRFEMSLGVRTWGNSASGSSRSIICAYEGRSEVSAPARCAAARVGSARAGVGHPVNRSAGRRSRTRRIWPGGLRSRS